MKKTRVTAYLEKEVLKRARIDAINQDYNSFSEYLNDLLKGRLPPFF